VVVVIDEYDAPGGTRLGTVTCRSADTGTMDVPASAFSSFGLGNYLAVTFWRYEIGTFPLPGGGTGESAGIVGMAGTGYLQ
jgi:hypothetical protein